MVGWMSEYYLTPRNRGWSWREHERARAESAVRRVVPVVVFGVLFGGIFCLNGDGSSRLHGVLTPAIVGGPLYAAVAVLATLNVALVIRAGDLRRSDIYELMFWRRTVTLTMSGVACVGVFAATAQWSSIESHQDAGVAVLNSMVALLMVVLAVVAPAEPHLSDQRYLEWSDDMREGLHTARDWLRVRIGQESLEKSACERDDGDDEQGRRRWREWGRKRIVPTAVAVGILSVAVGAMVGGVFGFTSSVLGELGGWGLLGVFWWLTVTGAVVAGANLCRSGRQRWVTWAAVLAWFPGFKFGASTGVVLVPLGCGLGAVLVTWMLLRWAVPASYRSGHPPRRKWIRMAGAIVLLPAWTLAAHDVSRQLRQIKSDQQEARRRLAETRLERRNRRPSLRRP